MLRPNTRRKKSLHVELIVQRRLTSHATWADSEGGVVVTYFKPIIEHLPNYCAAEPQCACGFVSGSGGG